MVGTLELCALDGNGWRGVWNGKAERKKADSSRRLERQFAGGASETERSAGGGYGQFGEDGGAVAVGHYFKGSTELCETFSHSS